MSEDLKAARLSGRFGQALSVAAELHVSQTRKSSNAPYVAHLLAVTSIVLDAGGTEDEAIAALLHDAVEDQGGAPTLQRIHDLFGQTVADIVNGCTETDQSPKPPWRERKETYLQHLRQANPSVRLVALADKLDNARATLQDYRRLGDGVWRRFNAGREEQDWWYWSLIKVFEETHSNSELVVELRSTVREIFGRT
jgi:(p)ppGpp synthase/HD superfamily hydrolase